MDMNDWLPMALVVGGYLVGSIPFGVVVARSLGTADPRTAGSRNIGFTNVLRVSGKKAGLLTLAGDVSKGWFIAWAASHMIDREAWVLTIAASPIIGHLYPIFLNFRGGKGVATALGAVTGVAPVVGGTMSVVWLVTAAIWRYSSGAAVAAFLVFPVIAAGLGLGWAFQVFSLAVAGVILYRHKDNAVRLWNGTEPKIGQRPLAT